MDMDNTPKEKIPEDTFNITLHESEERYYKLTKIVPHGIQENDISGVITFSNEAYARTLGYTAEEMVGKAIWDFYTSDSARKELKEYLALLVSEQPAPDPYFSDNRTKDGRIIHVQVHWDYKRDRNGKLVGFVSVITDISAQRELENQLQHSQKMEAIGTLVGGMAHDFNNVLAGLVGNIFIAKRKAGDNVDVINSLNNMEALSNRAAEMIRQLLTFARKDTVKMEPLAMGPFFKEAIKLACSGIPENIELTYNVSAQDMQIEGDSTQLQQLIMNLLNNARDAVADVPRPIINCQLELFSAADSFRKKHPDIKLENFVRLTVSDNGHGIPQDKQEKIFEPFFSTKSVGKGTGLGLSMVYGTVQRHNGTIELESETDKGTTLHIYLPLEEQLVEVISEKPAKVIQGQGETILLVDDEESVRSAVVEVMSGLGYKVLTATNGEEALKNFKSHCNVIDLLFTDLVMPKMGGLELAKAIRKLDENMPIIFATGYDKDHVLEGSTHMDNSLVISKPFAFNELSQLMRTLIESE
jgi:PAS domain S-box-containing protein